MKKIIAVFLVLCSGSIFVCRQQTKTGRSYACIDCARACVLNTMSQKNRWKRNIMKTIDVAKGYAALKLMKKIWDTNCILPCSFK
jgi:hypothetical protein